jgi:hypothetical protein
MQRFNPLANGQAGTAAPRKTKKGRRRAARTPVDATIALNRAVQGQSLANYPAIYAGFAEKGVPEAEIKPRENVFTFNAWKALGRVVKKGEHGVRIATVITIGGKETVDPETGEIKFTGFSRPGFSTVFHISQTEEWKKGSTGASPVVSGASPESTAAPKPEAPTPEPEEAEPEEAEPEESELTKQARQAFKFVHLTTGANLSKPAEVPVKLPPPPPAPTPAPPVRAAVALWRSRSFK